MPNFEKETHIEDAPWERLRAAMAAINAERHNIRNAERRIATATQEIYHVLWPRTDKTNKHFIERKYP